MDNVETQPDVIEDIKKHVSQLEQLEQQVPRHAVIGIGEYPIKVLLKGPFVEKADDTLSMFIDKSSGNIFKWSQSILAERNVLGLDADVDTHFWFHVLHYIAENSDFVARLKSKSLDKLSDALVLSSVWDGPGSALLPVMITQFKTLSVSSLALVLLPSKAQSPDAYFNAFSAMQALASKDLAPVVLIDRDQLEGYEGVDRKGTPINGNLMVNYLLEIMRAKERVMQEVSELSRSFNVKLYTVLSATGVSFKLYGSLENVLSTALFRPLLKFDLASASLLYVLVRAPLQLKDKLSKGKIELKVSAWFKERANLKAVVVTEPLYVDDASDRIDIVMLVGGFDTAELMALLEKKAKALKSDALERGLISKEEWNALSASSDEYYRTILSK